MSFNPILTTTLFFLFIAISCAPEPPSFVKKSFTTQFRNAQDVNWIKYDANYWEVIFYEKKFYYKTVDYGLKGDWLSTKVEVSEDDVPNQFLSILKLKYPKSLLITSFKQTTPTGNIYALGFTEEKELVILENETAFLRNDFIIEND